MQKLTKNQRNTINAIITARTRVSLDLEAISDDTKALAIELAIKPAQVNKLVSIVIRDQNKGGVIEEETALLELAEQMVNGEDE